MVAGAQDEPQTEEQEEGARQESHAQLSGGDGSVLWRAWAGSGHLPTLLQGHPGTPSPIPPAQGLALLRQTTQGSRSDNQPNVSIYLSKRQQFLFQGEQNNKTH